MENRKVLIVSSHLNYRTGLNTHMRQMYDFLLHIDFDPVYCAVSGGQTVVSHIMKDYMFHDLAGKADQFIRVVASERPAIVITFDDLWKIVGVHAARRIYPFFWIHHFLPEEDNLGADMVKLDNRGTYTISLKRELLGCDLIVPATEMGLSVLVDWDLKHHTRHILPFVDTNRIKYSKKAGLTFRDDKGIKPNDFLFTVVARNFARKNLPVVFEAFKLFADDIELDRNIKPKLYVHTVPRSPLGWDIDYLTKKYKSKKWPDAVQVRKMTNYNQEEPDSIMNALYSATDCLISVAYAEGLGYPVIESMLAERSVIYGKGGYPKYFADTKHNYAVKSAGEFIPYGSGFSQTWHYYKPHHLANLMRKAFDRGQIRSSLNRKRIIRRFNRKYLETLWEPVLRSVVQSYNTIGVLAL